MRNPQIVFQYNEKTAPTSSLNSHELRRVEGKTSFEQTPFGRKLFQMDLGDCHVSGRRYSAYPLDGA